MACKYATATDEWHGWECSVTEGACMFLHPNSKLCAKEYGEGPDADQEEEEDNFTLDESVEDPNYGYEY